MKRLTQKDENGWYLTGDGIYIDCGVPEKFRGEDIDRLAAIEDILGDDYDLDRLRKLTAVEKIMPGDTVYQTDSHQIYPLTVQKIIYDCGHIAFDKGVIGEHIFLSAEEAQYKIDQNKLD